MAVIEHQKDPRGFLRSIIAPLRTGGQIYLATPNVTHILNRVRFAFGRPPLGNLKEFFDAGVAFTGHWREYSRKELKSFFEWVDLDIVTARNLQSMKPSLCVKAPRDVYVHFFRLIGALLPGCGDTNILVGRKRDLNAKR